PPRRCGGFARARQPGGTCGADRVAARRRGGGLARGGRRGARRGRRGPRGAPRRARRPPALGGARRGTPRGRRARARRARRAARLGTLDRGRARRLPRLRRPGEALGAVCGGGRAGSGRAGSGMTLPAGYTLLGSAPIRAAIRDDLVPLLGPWLLAPSLVLPARAEPIASGRGAAYRVELPGGVRAVVRLYRRGGLVARAMRQTYLGL